MKVSKQEALILAKVLYQHTQLGISTQATEHQGELLVLADRIDDYLVKEKQRESKTSSKKDDVEEICEANFFIYGSTLHELKAAYGLLGRIEFECVELSTIDQRCRVDLLIDGFAVAQGLTHIRREGRELHIRLGNGRWITYSIKQYANGWAHELPLDKLVKIKRSRCSTSTQKN